MPLTEALVAQSLREPLGTPFPADDEDVTGFFSVPSLEQSIALAREFELDGQVIHLDTAIISLRRLLDQNKDGIKSQQLQIVYALGTVLCRRFEQRTLAEDIDDALHLLRDGISQLDDEDLVLRIPMMVQLAEALLLTVRSRGNPVVLDEALQLSRDIVHLCPITSEHYCAVLHDRSRVLWFSYRQAGSSELLEECLLSARQGLQHCRYRSAHDPESLRQLGALLTEKYKLTGLKRFSQESEEMLASSLKSYSACHPDRSLALSDLGHIFAIQRDVESKPVRTEKAVILAEEAVSICPIGHLARSGVLVNLVICFVARLLLTHDPKYIKRAEECARERLALCPPGHPGRVSSLNALATVLLHYVVPYGEKALGDLEEAISLYREALSSVTHNADSHGQSMLFANLANTLFARYTMLGHIGDLEENIYYSRGSLEHLEPEHIFYARRVAHLAQSLSIHAACTRSSSSLKEASMLLQNLLKTLNDTNSGEYAQALGLLGGVLLERYRQSGSLPDLHDGIQHLEDAVRMPQFTDDGSGHLCVLLGQGYAIRYFQLGNGRDADAALLYFDKALSRYHPGDDWHTVCLLDCAGLRIHRDEASLSSGLATVYDVLTGDDQSGGAGRILPKVASILEDAGKKGISYFLENGEVARQILDILSTLLPTLTEVAFVEMSASSRLASLTFQDAVFSSAVGYGRACGQLEQAIAITEHSRSVFWGQALNLRARMDDLPEDIRVEMLSLVQELELSTYTPDMQLSTTSTYTAETQLSTMKPMPKFQLASLDASIERRRQGSHFKALLARIRAMPGFERFLLHEEFDTLKHAARDGPVVLLVESDLSCEALILRASGDVLSVPLSGINPVWIAELSKSWDVAMTHVRSVSRDTEDGQRLKLVGKRLKGVSNGVQERVLLELWRKVVEPVIAALNLKKSTGKARPRLWWCCNGTFAFLPVHAAGDSSNRCSDYVVSSYIQTLGSLLRARKEFTPQPRAETKVLLSAVSIDDLPTTIEEISTISCIIPKEAHIPLPAAEDSRHAEFAGGATVDSVLQNIPNANILHLACHGRQDTEDPLNSGFILRDGKLTIARLMPVPLPRAFFAFMSACETAKGDVKYANQTIHLGAAMLFAGFKSVVGTMWSMDDVDGPVVAKTVYERLFEGDDEELDPNTIPYALDEAAQILRERGHPPGRWATYIHLGM